MQVENPGEDSVVLAVRIEDSATYIAQYAY